MATETANIYCEECDNRTLHERRIHDVSHLLHLVLTFCTCGLWLFVWMTCILFPDKDKWRCTDCGTKAKGRDIRQRG